MIVQLRSVEKVACIVITTSFTGKKEIELQSRANKVTVFVIR